ncbi:hypothetical protein [Belliella baltica]|uniref:hypothetical protein n=1 Tax=Belliella baltica TaxID=232259 RepID=UPI0012FA02CA
MDKKLDKLSYGAGLRMEAMDRDFNLQDRAGTLDTLYVYDYFRPFASANHHPKSRGVFHNDKLYL